MIYFKVFRGYGDDYVSIPEFSIDFETKRQVNMLEKAIYAQLSGLVLVTSGGTVAGNKIEMIKPDYHKSMGWNYSYRLEADDWNTINRSIGNLESRILEAGERVKYFMKTGQPNLIGTGAPLPELGEMAVKIAQLAAAKRIS